MSDTVELEAFSMRGKVALVTGATRGIGFATASALSRAGARVVITSEVAADIPSAVASLAKEGRVVRGHCCDVRDDAGQAALVEAIVADFGRLDAVVCNAGITGLAGPTADTGTADFADVMAINLRSAIVLANAARPHLAAGGGAVVLLGSLSAIRGNQAIGTYALAKAGLAQLARNLAVQWGPQNIRVNAVAPGLIATELSAPLLERSDFMERRMQMTPLRRCGDPAEVANAILFLLSPAAGFITGQNILIDGGTSITDGS